MKKILIIVGILLITNSSYADNFYSFDKVEKKLSVKIESKKTKIKILLTDSKGKKHKQKISAPPNSNISIDYSGLIPGEYTLYIYYEQNTHHSRSNEWHFKI
ncbi:MAG: hypothetical protein IKR41_12485 [Bacteroidales bacterium]|nr:hypothetical protein [Bacteroidales bacterium]